MGEWVGETVGPDVWETCRDLIPAGSVFAFLAEHRGELFPAEMFADMYPSANGRPSMPPQILAAVITLQALHGLSDFETVQELRCDLQWKAACGLGLHDMAFDPSLLAYFRRRLARSARPNRIFEAVREVVKATGVLRGKHRRALDSTVLDDAVASQDTVTQIIAAVRAVIREVPGAAEVAAVQCSAHDYTDPGKPRIAWNDEQARAELVDALVTDALRLLGHLPDWQLGDRAANAVGILALVAGQDVEPAEDSDGRDGRWRITQGTAHERIVSTVDPEARHIHKTGEADRPPPVVVRRDRPDPPTDPGQDPAAERRRGLRGRAGRPRPAHPAPARLRPAGPYRGADRATRRGDEASGRQRHLPLRRPQQPARRPPDPHPENLP
jgi:transposase